MVALIALFLLIAVLGLAAGSGHTADTRDPAFGLGRLTAHHMPRR